jgi:hypothetical protein
MTNEELMKHLDLEVTFDKVSSEYFEEFLKRMREVMDLQMEKASKPKDDRQLSLF